MKYVCYVLCVLSMVAGVVVMAYGIMRTAPVNPGTSDENLAVVGFLLILLGGLILLLATQIGPREQVS